VARRGGGLPRAAEPLESPARERPGARACALTRRPSPVTTRRPARRGAGLRIRTGGHLRVGRRSPRESVVCRAGVWAFADSVAGRSDDHGDNAAALRVLRLETACERRFGVGG